MAASTELAPSNLDGGKALSTPESGRLLMLVDWDNLDRRRGGSSSEIRYRVYLQRALTAAVRVSGAELADVRLYGGWLADGQLSRKGNEIAAVSTSEPLLPARHPDRREVLRGSIELVRSMMHTPSFEPSTYEELRGPRRVQLSRGGGFDACALDGPGCPAHLARKFTKAWNASCPTEGCEVSADHAFVRQRQKMVDTMLTCDALSARSAGYETLAVVSCDADLVPASLGPATTDDLTVVLLQPWPGLRPEYLKTLEDAGVVCLDLGLDAR